MQPISGTTDSFAQIRPRLEKALALARTAGLQQMEAEVLSDLALHGLYSGRPVHEIEAIIQQSLALYQKLGDSAGEAGALGMLAYIIYTQREGNYDLGIRYCERALQLASDGWDAERFVLGNLGILWLLPGRLWPRRPYLERQLVITRQAQNWRLRSRRTAGIGLFISGSRRLCQCATVSRARFAAISGK